MGSTYSKAPPVIELLGHEQAVWEITIRYSGAKS